jgi:hypothetical protein
VIFLEIKSYEISSIGYISPLKICNYLIKNGWQKKREIEDISVWVNKKENNLTGLFVPLRDDFVDYQNRVFDILYTLEEFENRPIPQIIESLSSSSFLAKLVHREVIEIQIKYLYEDKYDASLRKIGSIFKSLQDLIESIGEIKSLNRVSSLNYSSLKNQLEVSLIETFQGSFGFRLGFSQLKSKQLDLFDVPLTQDVAQEFLDLIRASSLNINNLENKLSQFSGKPFVKFKSLISHLINLDADIYLEWGSVDTEKGGAVTISLQRLLETLDFIEKREINNPTIITITATLVLAGVPTTKKTKKKRQPRFIAITLDQDEKEYQGSIHQNILNNKTTDLTVGRVYRMSIEQTIAVNSATGDEETTYTLVDLILIN